MMSEEDVQDERFDQLSTAVLREAVTSFFEFSDLLFIIVNRKGKILLANSLWERVLGWGQRELYKYYLSDLVHPDDLEESRSALKSVLQQDTVSGFRNRCRHRDGRWVQLEWHGYGPNNDKYIFGVAEVVGDDHQTPNT